MKRTAEMAVVLSEARGRSVCSKCTETYDGRPCLAAPVYGTSDRRLGSALARLGGAAELFLALSSAASVAEQEAWRSHMECSRTGPSLELKQAFRYRCDWLRKLKLNRARFSDYTNYGNIALSRMPFFR